MERHFGIAFTIAVAVHGLLLGIPRGPVPNRHVARPVDGDSESRPTIPLVPAEIPERDETAGGAPSAATDISRLPDRPTADDHTLFRVPVEVDTSARVSLVPLTSIPNNLLGGGGGAEGGPGRPVVAAHFLDHTPRARVRVPPEYPAAARHDARTATVVVEFIVDESGNVLAPRVTSPVDPEFDRAAVSAVGRWRFEPGTVNGRTVRFRMAVPIVFRLGDE